MPEALRHEIDHDKLSCRSIFPVHAAAAILVYVLAVSAAALAQPIQQPLDIHIDLPHTNALLGEPVWVEVTVMNRALEPVDFSWGANCPGFGGTPIEIYVPDALQGSGKPRFCGEPGGSCMIPGPTRLAPGESETRRYILDGDFRITEPGRYRVIVHKTFPWSPATSKVEGSLPPVLSTETADFEGLLEIMPSDPARLFAIEQGLAAEITQSLPTTPLNTPPGLSHEAYMATVRAWSEADRKVKWVASQHRYELYEGLAACPAAGMEPVFVSWDSDPMQAGYGITALRKLNTPEARKALAHLAEPLPVRVVNGVRQTNSRWVAISALAGTGDLTYLPLIEGYASDPDPQVRRAAIFGMGELGGEQVLQILDSIARKTSSQVERTDAISTIGTTRSAKAIRLLIALFDISNPGDPTAPSDALMTLTHHEVRFGDPARMKSTWTAWWTANRKTARIYGPYDCIDISNP